MPTTLTFDQVHSPRWKVLLAPSTRPSSLARLHGCSSSAMVGANSPGQHLQKWGSHPCKELLHENASACSSLQKPNANQLTVDRLQQNQADDATLSPAYCFFPGARKLLWARSLRSTSTSSELGLDSTAKQIIFKNTRCWLGLGFSLGLLHFAAL